MSPCSQVLTSGVVAHCEIRQEIDGKPSYIYATAMPIRSPEGRIDETILMLQDITNLEILRRSREELRLLTDNVPTLIASLDSEQRYRLINKNYAEWFGLREEQIIGKSVKEVLGEPGYQKLKPHIENVLNGQTTLFEAQLPTREGSMRWVAATYVPEIGKNGKVQGFYALITDITRHKIAEKELVVARKVAEAANIAQSDFLANMSHEIRTPMNGVIGMAGLLLDTDLNEEQRDYAETVERSAESLLTIINDILDFSKIEAGKLDIEPISFDLQVAVAEVAELLVEKAESKQIELILRYAPGIPDRFIGDPGRIRQVLTNLVANAIKFTEKGHVLYKC